MCHALYQTVMISGKQEKNSPIVMDYFIELRKLTVESSY